MSPFFFFLALLQCALLWLAAKAGQTQTAKAAMEREAVRKSDLVWPSCALIIPVSGNSPLIEPALRSLLMQDYPDYQVYIVTADNADPACAILERLRLDNLNFSHVTAGRAHGCGQKNHNLLAGLVAAGRNADVYAFCDATHLAEADFLRCLLLPQAKAKAAFSAGYHEVIAQDKSLVTLGYVFSVLFMRFLQGISGLTQPWGGAMAMTRSAFEHFKINELWASNVVDDCSLGAFLKEHKVRVAYCPGALLRTIAANHKLSVWAAWLERQILFLKFCFRGQWLGLCLFSCFMLIPFICCAVGVLEGLFNFGSFSSPFLALCWFFLFMGLMSIWRAFISIPVSLWRCFLAFALASCMFFLVSLRTAFTMTIRWRNISYRVGKNGKVLSIKEG